MAVQRSFDDLGTPLCDVTFVVVDLETTGGSPADCAITEVGAVKLRGGESLGTLATLVNPGVPIPPSITYLTGITEAMVLPAPPIEAVLPALAEFIGDAVVVGHNVRFDLGFLRAALQRSGRPVLANRFVDTCALARRLVADEVPNHKLDTLATHFRTANRPTHRALADALATGELLHCLLERAGSLGVLALDDLLELPTVRGHPQLSKLRLAARLPRSPGVYVFRDGAGRPLYVGKAVDLRRRVRSYFTSDRRRKIGPLLRAVHRIDHVVCAGELEASVLELRLIRELNPSYNRRGKRRRDAYLKLTLDEPFPRLAVVHRARTDDQCVYVGPLPSAAVARQVADAVLTAVPLRRCTARLARGRLPVRDAPCAPAQLGVATCPCACGVDEGDYAAIVDQALIGLTIDPAVLLDPLAARLRALAEAGRYEEAAEVRDRAAALSRALTRRRRVDALVQAGRLTIETPEGGRAVIHSGLLQHAAIAMLGDPAGEDEVAVVASWLDQRAGRARIIECEAGLAWPAPRLPRFEPGGGL